MKERLVIKNFGPIKSVDLELGKMTVLIGEQATGKSTIAKVLAVCRYFSFITNSSNNLIYINDIIYVDNIFNEYGIHEYINEDSHVFYECRDYKLQITNVHDGKYFMHFNSDNKKPIKMFMPEILEEKSVSFKSLMNEYRNLNIKSVIENFEHKNSNIPTSFLLNEVKDVMNNPFYFPTERGLQSIFSLGKDSIHNLSSLLFNQFSKLNEIAINYKNEFDVKPLDITYKNIHGFGYIKKETENTFYALSTGASGYQSAIPIILGIDYYTNVLKRKNRIFIVEEPELNLFPKAQKKLMEFFVENINNNGHSFLLPTHSPYILSSIENLMYAYTLGNVENGIHKEKVKSIVPENYWINPEDVSVYYLNNGEAKNILDRKEALIDKDYIDSVSKILNDEFDELLNIEVEYEH